MRPFVGVCVVALLVACGRPQSFGTFCDEEVSYRVPAGASPQLDLVFVIDDSPAMAPVMPAVQSRLRSLVAKLIDTAQQNGIRLDLHLAVVGSDGTGQLAPAVGPAAPSSCAPTSDGAPYLALDTRFGTSNLPAGEDLPTAFACMAALGTNGSPYPQLLEAALQALRSPGGAPLLRPNALLMLVFVSNGDDCSAPPTSTVLDPSAPAASAGLRCVQADIVCGSPPMPPPSTDGGPLAACMLTPAMTQLGGLFDLQRYIDLLTRPAAQGGLKSDPLAIIVATLTGPTVPFVVHNQALAPSCQSQADPSLAASPALRLTTLAGTIRVHDETSLCADSYDPLLQELFMSSAGPPGYLGCLGDRPAPASCVAVDITLNPDGTTTQHELPACPSSGGAPCWQIVDAPSCAQQPGSSPRKLEVVRTSEPPFGTYTQVWCDFGC
jgi:hypothetical protein